MWWVQEEGDGSECSVGKDLHSTAGGWVSGVMHSHYTKHVLAIVTQTPLNFCNGNRALHILHPVA